MRIADCINALDHAAMTELRHILRERRELLGLTQGEVAEALGEDLGQVWRWESGKTKKIPAEVALRLMQLYRLSVEDVLAQMGPPEAVDPRRAVEEKVSVALSNRGLSDVGRVGRESAEAPAPPRRSRGGKGRQG